MKANINGYKIVVFVSVLFCLFIASPVWSAIYYVDVVSGSDSNDGLSSGTAWGTLHFAVSQLNGLDTAGHVLNVAPGTYSVDNPTNLSNPETDTALELSRSGVTIQGETGVIVEGPPDNATWWTGIYITASNITIKNIEIHSFSYEARPALEISGGSSINIQNCKLSGNDYGIYVTSAANVVVTGCEIHNNTSEGIYVDDSGIEINRNTLYNNNTNIYIGNSIGSIAPDIINNLIYKSAASNIGIYLYAFTATISPRIYHNTIYGVTTGIYMYEDTSGTIAADIQYNIISMDAAAGTGISFTGYFSGFTGTIDYNNVWNFATNYNGLSAGTNDVSKDPHFVDAAGLDFHLAPTSWLLDLIRADAGDTVEDDLDGVTRPKGLGREMGCYEVSDTDVLWVYDAGAANRRLVFPDINGDGYDDVLLHINPISEEIVTTTLRVVSGADGSTELWSYTLPLGRKGISIIDDLDDDEIKDIIVITGTSGNLPDENYGDDQIYAISGAVTPVSREIWSEPRVIGYSINFPVVVPDTNGDGYADIFANTATPAAPYSAGDHVFHISGKDGTDIWNAVDSSLWDIYGRTAASDLNGDLKADFIATGATTPTSGGVEAWQGGGTGAVHIWSQVALAGENITNPAMVGDLNADGVSDIGVGKFHTHSGTCPDPIDPRLYILCGATGFPIWDYGLQRTPSSISDLGDVTGDGIEDVVIGTRILNTCGDLDSSVYALEGNPDVMTRVIWTYPLTSQDSYVKVIPDANGDGKKDVIVTGQIDKLLILSGADGTELSQATFPDTVGTAQIGEFNNATGEDILINYGYHIYALSFPPTSQTQNNPPAAPVTVFPADEAVVPTLEAATLTLQASDFSDPDNDAHGKSYWEVERFDSQELLPAYMEVPSEVGLTSHSVQDFLEPGLKYAWRVKYEDEHGATSQWSTKSPFKVGDSVFQSLPEVTPGKSIADYGMISIVHWPDDPSPNAVFDIRYDPRYYKIGTYDPVTGQYIEYGGNLVIEPGRSYWMLARKGITVNFNGIAVNTTESIQVCLHHGADGWNMIAPPNDANYQWGNVQVAWWDPVNMVGEGPFDISTIADNNTLIDKRIWEWQNGTYEERGSTFILKRYKGYWVKALKPDVYLIFSQPIPEIASISNNQTMLASLMDKTRQWLKKIVRGPKEAVADNDMPPMPMGALVENDTENFFSGCFVEVVEK